jgi:hypothetical protein
MAVNQAVSTALSRNRSTKGAPSVGHWRVSDCEKGAWPYDDNHDRDSREKQQNNHGKFCREKRRSFSGQALA